MAKAAPAREVADRITDELMRFLECEREFLELEAMPLVDELEALIAAGGKRLRPLFCYWGHRAAGGGDSEKIDRAAAALELLHTFALIHDDVMDASPTRRSRLSSFRALAELGRGAGHRGDPRRFGMSAALLTGLLGFVLADRLLQTSGFEPGVLSVATERWDRMRTSAITGQYLDILAAHVGEADEGSARRIGAMKSGSYSVLDPLVIGAILAGAPPKTIETLEAFGRPLGEAFQIADDLVSVLGDPAVTGKDADGDIREGKQTVLLAKARKMATEPERKLLETRVGDPQITVAETDLVREILINCGARDATQKLVQSLHDEAVAALDVSGVGDEAAEALRALAAEATAGNV